jgi:hypothetical protein
MNESIISTNVMTPITEILSQCHAVQNTFYTGWPDGRLAADRLSHAEQ